MHFGHCCPSSREFVCLRSLLHPAPSRANLGATPGLAVSRRLFELFPVPVATALVLFLWLASSGSAQTPSPPPEPVVNLSAGQPLTLAVKPREFQTVRISGIPGKYNELLMELPAAGVRGRYVKVQPEPVSGPDAADPAISDSGQDFVRFPLPDTAGVTVLHVTVLTNSKADSAP